MMLKEAVDISLNTSFPLVKYRDDLIYLRGFSVFLEVMTVILKTNP